MDSKETKLTRQELEAMLKLYNIGKKPLSKLLGWGETTILLYLEQEDIPDNELTRKLKGLYTDPCGYFSLLQSNRNAISAVAYKKSLEAVRTIFSRSGIIEAALKVNSCNRKLLAEQSALANENMSLARLEAILFWSQAFSLSLYNKALVEDDYQPGKSGLPYRALEERVRQYGCIEPEGLYEGFDEAVSDERQEDIIMFVTRTLNWYGPVAIDRLNEAERFRLCGPKGARRRRIVSKDMLKSCYSEVALQMKVKQPKDIEGYLHKRMTFVRKSL